MPKKVLYETTAPKMNFRKISDASILFEPNDLKSGKKTVYSQILLPDEDTIRRLSIPKNIQFENLNFNKNANLVSKSRFLKNSDRVPVSFNQPANINLSPVIENADLVKNSLLLKNSDRMPVSFNQPANIRLQVIDNVRNFKRQGYNCPSLLWLTILAVIILLLQLLFIYLFCKFKI